MTDLIVRLVVFALVLECSVRASERTNILLITADDLGIQLSCYGDPIAKTPNIDELAKQSVRFQTAYVSQASCSPSRSTMFTGLYPHAHGARILRLTAGSSGPRVGAVRNIAISRDATGPPDTPSSPTRRHRLISIRDA